MREFLTNEDAPTMVEYALLLSLIALVAVVGVTLFGTAVGDMYADINNNMPP